MSQDTRTLPSGAGATTHSTGSDNRVGGSRQTNIPSGASPGTHSGASSSFRTTAAGYETRSDRHPPGRGLVVTSQRSEGSRTGTILAGTLLGAIAGGVITSMLAKRPTGARSTSESAVVRESVTINRSARELYDFWRDFTNLPQFMDNIKSVERLDERRSHWVIKAPAGTSVAFNSRVVDEVPGKLIAWQSEEGASVPNRGRVEFDESQTAGATVVRVTMSYDPPAGAAGRLVAKIFQREPAEQARQDLARLKALMETGGVR